MPLQPQRTAFAVTAGQQQAVAPELIDPPMLARAHNRVFHRGGELIKRLGWETVNETLADAQYMPILEKLATCGDEVLWIGEQRGFNKDTRQPLEIISRVPAESLEYGTNICWHGKGVLPRFSTRRLREISHTWDGSNRYLPTPRIQDFDCAVAGSGLDRGQSLGVICCVWDYSQIGENTRLDYAIVDIASRALLSQGIVSSEHAPSLTAGAPRPIRVVALQHVDGLWNFHIFYTKGDWAEGTANVYHRSIPAADPTALSSEGLFASGVSGFDVCVTGPYAVSSSWTRENRLFYVNTSPADTNVYCSVCTADSSGALTQRAYAALPMVAVTSGTPLARSVHCCCDPDGAHVAAHLVVIAPGCVGTPYNVACQWNIAESPSHTVTPYDDCVIVTGSSSTSLDVENGGCQIGWAGTSVVSTVTRRDNWFVTWQSGHDIASNPNYNFRYACFPANGSGTLSLFSMLVSSTAAFRVWGRMFNLRGQCYSLSTRGLPIDSRCVEVQALGAGGQEGGDAYLTYRVAGRALQGEIAFQSSYPGYPMIRGRNSIVESPYEAGRFFTAIPVVSNDNQQHKLAIIDFDARDPQRFGSAELFGATYFTGGVPWTYDGGGRGHELGFPHRPGSLDGTNGSILVASVTSTPP